MGISTEPSLQRIGARLPRFEVSLSRLLSLCYAGGIALSRSYLIFSGYAALPVQLAGKLSFETNFPSLALLFCGEHRQNFFHKFLSAQQFYMVIPIITFTFYSLGKYKN